MKRFIGEVAWALVNGGVWALLAKDGMLPASIPGRVFLFGSAGYLVISLIGNRVWDLEKRVKALEGKQ